MYFFVALGKRFAQRFYKYSCIGALNKVLADNQVFFTIAFPVYNVANIFIWLW